MIEIPLGRVFIEADLQREEVASLAASPDSPILIRLFREQSKKSVERVREAVTNGDLNTAISEESTAKTYEELAVMFESGLAQALKSES